MARYVDVDKLIEEYDRVHIGAAGGARKLMVEAPTADVAEVVRCKDCEHYTNFDTTKRKRLTFHFCDKFRNITEETAFCSYGAKKDIERNDT